MISEPHLHAACCDLVGEVVRASGSANLKVTGLSMLPAIWPGDVLTVNHVAPELLAPGQIVLYRQNVKLTAHRVVDVKDGHILARGDCVPSLDSPVPFTEIVGQVTAIRRNGRVIQLQSSPWQRTAAWFLRHSELSIKLLLHFRAASRRLIEIPDNQAL